MKIPVIESTLGDDGKWTDRKVELEGDLVVPVSLGVESICAISSDGVEFAPSDLWPVELAFFGECSYSKLKITSQSWRDKLEEAIAEFDRSNA
jgi:hypothetical protein